MIFIMVRNFVYTRNKADLLKIPEFLYPQKWAQVPRCRARSGEWMQFNSTRFAIGV